RGSGSGQRSRDEETAAVPIRSPPVRGPGRANGGATRRREAERQRAEGRRRYRDAQGRADAGSVDVRTLREARLRCAGKEELRRRRGRGEMAEPGGCRGIVASRGRGRVRT